MFSFGTSPTVIEKANQKFLYGIFGDAQWTNKERLSDELLINLIEKKTEKVLADIERLVG